MATIAEMDLKATKKEVDKVSMDIGVQKVELEITKDRMNDFNTRITSCQHETNSIRSAMQEKIDNETFYGMQTFEFLILT